MPRLKNVRCPACGSDFYDFRKPNCVDCGEPIRIARSVEIWTGRLVLAAILLVAVAAYRPGVSGRWILGVVAAGIFLGFVASRVIPLKLERGTPEVHRFNFLVAVLAVAFSVFVTEFMFFGAAFLLVGGKAAELQDYLDILSTPVAFLEKGFLITPSSGFLDLCGTMLGNSFIYSALILICYSTVRLGFKRGEVAQMDLSGTSVKNDED